MTGQLRRICRLSGGRLACIGRSESGTAIPVLILGNPGARYAILVQGAIHGREYLTAQLIMALAEEYVLRGGLKRWKETVFHLIPIVNPDGAAISRGSLRTKYLMGIYEKDCRNGFTSPNLQSYFTHWKANACGVDLNRNFSAGWESITDKKEPSFAGYRGTAPESAREARALAQYARSRHFSATISYHASGSVIYSSYGNKEPVNCFSKELACRVSRMTGYPIENTPQSAGGFKDWAIDTLEVPSLTIEVGREEAPLASWEFAEIWRRNKDLLFLLADWAENTGNLRKNSVY